MTGVYGVPGLHWGSNRKGMKRIFSVFFICLSVSTVGPVSASSEQNVNSSVAMAGSVASAQIAAQQVASNGNRPPQIFAQAEAETLLPVAVTSGVYESKQGSQAAQQSQDDLSSVLVWILGTLALSLLVLSRERTPI